MFMFTLSLQRNSIGEDLTLLVERIANPGNAQKRSVSGAIRQGFQDNYTTQGAASGTPWRPLAAFTVLDRQKQGYGGTGPILVRTGRLRSTWVGEGSGHYSSFRQSGGYAVWEEGSDDPIALKHELGEGRVPARPVSLLGERSEARIMDVIDLMISQLEREVMGR